jgi:protein-disulfide isomerase
MEQKQNNFITLPAAIVIAGAIIAIAIIWTKSPSKTPTTNANGSDAATAQNAQVNLSPVTSADHILGNPNAAVKIVEFSDTSCPYCKEFNPTMVNLMKQYGDGGKVAWIYRSYPLDTPDASGRVLHPNSNHEGQALECAAELGGNAAFWKYEQRLYEITPGVTGEFPQGLDQSLLPKIAKEVGLNQTKFTSCLDSGKYKQKINEQAKDGFNAGVSGTPTSLILLDDSVSKNISKKIADLLVQYRVSPEVLEVANNGQVIIMRGALPAQLVNSLIGTILTN